MTLQNEDILLGVDYGDTNIGVAFGRNGLVSPVKTINGVHQLTAVNEITRIAMQNKCTKIIMGLPLSYTKHETLMSKKARAFAKLLKIYLKLPVEFENEFGTTIESIEEAIQQGISRKNRGTVDHISAALILKRYYNEHA